MYTFFILLKLLIQCLKNPKTLFRKAIYGQKNAEKKTTKIPQTKSKTLLASMMMDKFKQSVSL